MRDVLIGIDAGTSVIKSVAFDLGGRQIAACAIPNSYESEGGKGVVQDLNRTWRDAAKTLSDLAGSYEVVRTMRIALSPLPSLAITAPSRGGGCGAARGRARSGQSRRWGSPRRVSGSVQSRRRDWMRRDLVSGPRQTPVRCEL